METTHGFFITIEGIEGAGKTTAKDCIASTLTAANIPFVLTREPGGTLIAEKIREMLLHSSSETIQPETELLLLFAARVQHLHTVILPALAAGKWVVSDRYIDASYAYQGAGRTIPIAFIQMLDNWLVKSSYPDLTLLLDLPPEIGFKRTEVRGAKDRIESEALSFFNHVRQEYLRRAEENKKRIVVIDATKPLDVVSSDIIRIITDFIEAKK